MNDENGSINMPPNTGNAMARATSAPRPVANSTGSNAISVVIVVIMQGRMRFNADFRRGETN
jgi:hypothetical protein